MEFQKELITKNEQEINIRIEDGIIKSKVLDVRKEKLNEQRRKKS